MVMGEKYFQGLVLINSVVSQLVHGTCSIGVPGKEYCTQYDPYLDLGPFSIGSRSDNI